MQKIAAEFLNQPIEVKPGEKLHLLVALLSDTHYDDVTQERVDELVSQVESWRWCNAAGQRVS